MYVSSPLGHHPLCRMSLVIAYMIPRRFCQHLKVSSYMKCISRASEIHSGMIVPAPNVLTPTETGGKGRVYWYRRKSSRYCQYFPYYMRTSLTLTPHYLIEAHLSGSQVKPNRFFFFTTLVKPNHMKMRVRRGAFGGGLPQTQEATGRIWCTGSLPRMFFFDSNVTRKSFTAGHHCFSSVC